MRQEVKPAEPEVLSFTEAAEFLRVSERTLRRLVAEKKVPHAKIGGLLRFRKTALLEWLQQEERRNVAGAEAPSTAVEPSPEASEQAGRSETAADTAEERRARVYALAGKYAHVPTSVDEFLRRKQEEIDLEEERFQRRWKEWKDPQK